MINPFKQASVLFRNLEQWYNIRNGSERFFFFDVSLVKRSSSEKIKARISSDENTCVAWFNVVSNGKTSAETGPSAKGTYHLHSE